MRHALILGLLIVCGAASASPEPEVAAPPPRIECCFVEGCMTTTDRECAELMELRNAAERTEALNWAQRPKPRRDGSAIELSSMNLAYQPGSRLVRVLACVDVKVTQEERVLLNHNSKYQLCRVELDDVCAGDDASIVDLMWELPRLSGSAGPRAAEAPIEDQVFWITLRSKLLPDGAAVVGFSQAATVQEASCSNR